MANGIDLSQFHEIFYEESYEGLEAMESGLLKLDQGSSEPEVVNTVFRAAHSIKGSAATFGFSDISGYTHVVETLLDEVRSGTRDVTKDLVDVLLKSVDFIRLMINQTKAGESIDEAEVEQQTQAISKFAVEGVSSSASPAPTTESVPDSTPVETVVPPEETSIEPQEAEAAEVKELTEEAPAVEQKPQGHWLITFKPHQEIMLTGNDPYRYLRELRELGDLHTEVNTRDLSNWAAFDPECCYLSWEVQLPGSVEKSEIDEIFEWISDDCVFTIEKVIDYPEGLPAEILTPVEAVAVATSTPVASSMSPAFSGGVASDERNQELSSIRVNIDKVDSLVNLVGELVITQSILNQFSEDGADEIDREKLLEGLVQLERNTRQLQEETMRIRMLPIDSVFQRLPRLVRDLSGSLSKKVELKMRGNQTEVDKTVLEKIADPLMHLIRNSMDHGIESPDERVRIGKPETGLVDINAYHEGGNIIIEVMDDGAGLNKERILQKALEKGLLKSEEELTDLQVQRLIFAAGFTTAEQLSDVSGRGVGMDVVNKNILDLGGSIEVSSSEGKGSKFTIKLPLTLAIVDSQLVRVGSEVLIIPLLSIVKSVQVTASDMGEVAGEIPVFHFQEEYIPVIHLDKSFGINVDEEDTDRILVVVDVGQKVGLLINEVVGLQQVVIKSLDSNYRQIEGISGATILGDGKVAMIVDIGGLIRQEEVRRNQLSKQMTA